MFALPFFVGGLFTFFDDQIFYFARLGICSRSFNPDARGTGYTVFAARVKQIFQRIHGGRNVIASPISTTVASCLKNAASVYTFTLKNKPEIVMLFPSSVSIFMRDRTLASYT